MIADEWITITQGDKKTTFHRDEVGFDMASNRMMADFRSGERINIELDYSEAPAAYFTVLANLGLLSKNSSGSYTLTL